MDEFSLTSVPMPLGYETVYKNNDGSILTCPLIAITFQTFDFGLGREPGDCLNVTSRLWDLTREDLDEVDVGIKGYLGIKYPGETLEEFLEKHQLGDVE